MAVIKCHLIFYTSLSNILTIKAVITMYVLFHEHNQSIFSFPCLELCEATVHVFLSLLHNYVGAVRTFATNVESVGASIFTEAIPKLNQDDDMSYVVKNITRV